MNSLQKMTLVIGALAVLSTAALAIRCPCVTLGKDTCGGCPDSNCDGTLCSAPLRYSQLAGWDQVVPGFSTQQFSGKFVVSEVLPASPAERAGVRVGDELVSLDGMRVPLCRGEAANWQNHSAKHAVVVRRAKTTLTLEVAPIRLSALLQRSVPVMVQNVALGTGSALLPRWSPFLSGLVLSPSGKGAMVVSVLPGSSGAKSGIRPGDTILSSDGFATGDLSQIEGADYRADLTLRVAGPWGERTVRLTMSSVADIFHALAHNGGNRPSVSQGF